MCTWNPPSTHRILIGRSPTARPSVLTFSNILPQPTSHCAFIRARTKSLFKNCVSLKVSWRWINRGVSVNATYSAKRRKSVPHRQLSNPEHTGRKSPKSCRFTSFCNDGKKKIRHARNSQHWHGYRRRRNCLYQSISSLCCMTNSLRLRPITVLYFCFIFYVFHYYVATPLSYLI
jgi:hypothetical protein